jgi:hypothetical protein
MSFLTTSSESNPGSKWMHPKYTERYSEWEDVRNGLSGGRRIKQLATRYLPKNDDEARYTSLYLRRARWPAWLEQAYMASLGQIFRRDPEFTLPTNLEYLENSAGPSRQTLYSMSQTHIRESLQAGSVIMVDAPESGGDPYLTILPRSRCTDWGYRWEEGALILEYVILCENYRDQGKTKQRYRRLYLDEGKVYRQKLMDHNGKVLSEATPSYNGSPLDFLPVVIQSSYEVTPEPRQSPFTALFDICIEAYQYSADIGWTARHNAQPILKLKGFQAGENPNIKNEQGILQCPPNGDAEYLRLEGDTFLTDRYKVAAEEASALGAQVAAPEASQQTATGALISLAAETASLTLMSCTASEAMTQALKMIGRWIKLSDSEIEEIKFEYNTKFAESTLSAGRLAELMESFLRGGISADDYVAELRKSDFGDASKDYSAEVRRLESIKADYNPLVPQRETPLTT